MQAKTLSLILTGAATCLLMGCDSSEVQMVKGGTLHSCPNTTVEQMVDSYMANPDWESITSSDGDSYVNISGDISYAEKDVRATLQFKIDQQTFEFQAFEINDVPMNSLLAMSLLAQMCSEAPKGS